MNRYTSRTSPRRAVSSYSSLKKGFTIVELIVVVVVVGIIAGIVIVAYNGVSKNATEVSMKSDLDNAATQLAMDSKRNNGVFPYTAASANGGKGLVTSQGNTFAYSTKSYGYCVSISNSKTTKVFSIKASNPTKIEEAPCTIDVTTFAGACGVWGDNDGMGPAAGFGGPYGIAVDAADNVYVADRGTVKVRKITPAGVSTVLAGTGGTGDANGSGATATFRGLAHLDVDAAGTVYVAEDGGHRIRKITSAGVVSVLAGSGVAGSAIGTGAAAQFRNPGGVAVDASGNIYVADTGNHRIRMVTPAGVVSNYAGTGVAGATNGPIASAQFSSPDDIAIDAAGNLYVSDKGNYRVRIITPGGTVSTLAGSTYGFTNATGTAAQFQWITGLDVDSSGNVYVVEEYPGNKVRMITPGGVVTTYAGTGTSGCIDGIPTVARFSAPHAVAVDSLGKLYVADYDNFVIRKIE